MFFSIAESGIKKYPAIKISRSNTDNTIRIKERGNSIFFDATYNQKTLETLFDTGVSSYFLINEKVGDSIGVKRIKGLKNDSSVVINGVLLQAEKGIIDSIKIANITLYNLPVVIYDYDPDSLLKDHPERENVIRHFSQLMDVVIGYPAMFLMKKITLDFENNTLSLPNNLFVPQIHSVAPNMFVYANGLYTRLQLMLILGLRKFN